MRVLLSNNKPILLIFPYNVMAHYLRCIHLSAYLQPYFTIKFLHSAQYNVFVAKAGFETFECETLDADKVQQCIKSFDFSWLNVRDLSRIYSDQVKIINQLGASAVLGDMSPTLKMAAEKTGVFYISLLNAYMSRHYRYVRKMPRNFSLYKLFNLFPGAVAEYFINVGEQISFHDIHHSFSKIRKRAGLVTKCSYPQELEGDLNLLCDLKEIFPQKNLPANYHFIPPLFNKISNDNDEIVEKLDKNKKTLLISMGSTGDWQKVAFLNNEVYQKYNIVTAGDNDKIIKGDPVFSYRFINSAKLLSVTDLVICHGGNGTTYQALSFGIPVLCKTSHLEQEYNVDGLERLQLGKSLNDINSSDEYEAVIEKWIQMKNSTAFRLIRDKMTESVSRFEKTIETILTKFPATRGFEKQEQQKLLTDI